MTRPARIAYTAFVAAPTEQALVFDRVAALYDAQRPGYPDALFDDLVAELGLAPDAQLLEIGAGTGKATLPFLRRGFAVHAVEPGEAMAQHLAANAAPWRERFELQRATLESAALPAARFALAYVAQAYHWLDPGTRLERIAGCLAPDGALAVFGNAPRISDTPVHDAVQRVYRRFWPEAAGKQNRWYGSADSPVARELAASRHFAAPQIRVYRHAIGYAAADYAALMRTHSDHQMLAASQLEALVAEIERAIAGHGGSIVVEHATTLFVSRRAASG